MAQGDETGGEEGGPARPLWLPPRRPEPEPERPIGPQGWLPPKAPGARGAPDRRWEAPLTSVPPPATGPPTTAQGRALASWWARVWATTIDSIIIAVAALILVGGVFGAAGVRFLNDSTTVGEYVLSSLAWISVVAIVGLLYAPWLMARTNGQTLGKMVARIRVVRVDGQPIDRSFAAYREIGVKTVGLGLAGSATLGLGYLADYLWPLWDPENRALHDMVADTRVVRAS
jgi:uncharacterized RDD family membrane protein YckC